MVPVPTFEKLRFRFQFQLHIKTIKSKFFKKKFGKCFAFLLSKVFYKEKDYKFKKIYCKFVNEKLLNEGNQIHNFISSSGSGAVINYGSGSDFLTSYGSGSGCTTLRSCPAHGRGAWPAAGWSSGGRWAGAARPPSAPPPLPLARCSLRMRDPPFRNDTMIR
jgi:hypothetical protein